MSKITQEELIDKARIMIAARLGWGDSKDWLNQDFINLSEKIFEKTGVSLSHQTLKRLWGKVKYESLPNTHTLNTLAQYLDYENWLEFRFKQEQETQVEEPVVVIPEQKNKSDFKRYVIWSGAAILLAVVLINIISGRAADPDPKDYAFSSKKVVSEGIPNSVIFDLDAAKSPDDSVIIQQSWDNRLQSRVHKNQKQHTSIYYYPGYFNAKLIVGNTIVKEHGLLIKSSGWMPIIRRSPVPVYLKNEEVITNGKMSVSQEQIAKENVSLKPEPPEVLFTNIQDYGEIYSDDFEFETSFKNDVSGGSSVCQYTTVYLQCQGNVIWANFSAKGCVSDLNLVFTGHFQDGKKKDLSGFGVDFNDFVKLKIVSKGGKAVLMVNDKVAYEVNDKIDKAKIIGISFNFHGTGTVDYVKLSNKKVHFEDNFGDGI